MEKIVVNLGKASVKTMEAAGDNIKDSPTSPALDRKFGVGVID